MTEQDKTIANEATATIPPAARNVSGGMGSARAWFVFGQALAALGAIITFMGLGEHTWVVRTYNFLRSDKAIPVVGMALWVGGGVVLWWRAKGRQEALAFLSALLPRSISQTNGPLKPSVQLAVDRVTVAGLVSPEPAKVATLDLTADLRENDHA